MKKFVIAILLSVFLLPGVGCFHFPVTMKHPNVVMRVLDPTLEPYAIMWQKEVGRRVDNAVVVLVHGGDFVEGQWIVGDWTYRSGLHVRPIEDAIKDAHKAFPDRIIVVLACNPGHITLHKIEGVNVPIFYAHSSVWCIPDRNAVDVVPSDPALMAKLGDSRWESDPDVVGNIFEFIEAN